MSLEGFSKKGMELGNDPEGIKETRNNLQQEYLNAVKRLSLMKLKNDLLFEGHLGAEMRRLSSLGLNISKENIIKDIQAEINKQQFEYNLGFDSSLEIEPVLSSNDREAQKNVNEETDEIIAQLKSNLGSIFEGQNVQPTNIVQPQQIAEEAQSITQQSFDEIYDLEIKRLTEIKKNNNPNYELELANTIKRLSTLTTKISNFREQIESDIDYELSKETKDGKQEQVSDEMNLQQPQQVEKSTEPTPLPTNQDTNLEQQKKGIIENILKSMVDAGEFSYIPIEEMGKRLDAIQYAKMQLESKSIDELIILLSTYSNNYEKESSGMHR